MDDRRKRLLYRATHRGTKESDLIFGGFISAHVATLPEATLDQTERLLEENDIDLVEWATGQSPIPDRWKGSVLEAVIAYHRSGHA